MTVRPTTRTLTGRRRPAGYAAVACAVAVVAVGTVVVDRSAPARDAREVAPATAAAASSATPAPGTDDFQAAFDGTPAYDPRSLPPADAAGAVPAAPATGGGQPSSRTS